MIKMKMLNDEQMRKSLRIWPRYKFTNCYRLFPIFKMNKLRNKRLCIGNNCEPLGTKIKGNLALEKGKSPIFQLIHYLSSQYLIRERSHMTSARFWQILPPSPYQQLSALSDPP